VLDKRYEETAFVFGAIAQLEKGKIVALSGDQL